MIPGLSGQWGDLGKHATAGQGPQSPCLMHTGTKKWDSRKVKAQGAQVRDRTRARFQVSSLQGGGTSISFYKFLITQVRRSPHLKEKMQVSEKKCL